MAWGRSRWSDQPEFVVVTHWDSVAALEAFAGPRWQEAIIEPDEEHLLAEVICDHDETVERADRSSQAWLLAPTNLGSMWSTQLGFPQAIRVFGALLALEAVTGLGRILPMPWTDIPPGWDERTILTTFLDYVHAKCEHLAEAHARRAPLPGSPLMTLAGLVNHLRWVEYFWFQVMLLGEEDHGPWTEEDPDREMRIAVAVPIAQLLDEYKAQCGRYRDLVASLDLDTPSKRPVDGRPITLRWILFHLVEETARHNGHLDILRELADGVTGT